MESWHGKVALVTNCGSDLGVSIIEELSKNGINTVGFGKDQQTIDSFSSKLKSNTKYGKILLCKCDETNYSQLNAAITKIMKDYGGIDILIDNHFSDHQEVQNEDFGSMKDVIDTDITATVACVRLVAANIVGRKARGHIIFVNNNEDHKRPNLTDATKTAVSSINELLRHEFRYLKANIKTTIIECKRIDNEEENHDKLKVQDVTEVIMSVLDTPEHLHIHEVFVE